MTLTYETFKTTSDFLLGRIGYQPEIGIILGSGLGHFADHLTDQIVVNYSDIPGFLTSTAVGHAGKMIFGTIAGKKVVCMSGRFHYYEGYEFEELSIPVRVLKLLGIRALLLTNAAGAVNADYRPGDIMLISDHIKLMGASPMRGKNIDEFGPRFFDMTKVYSKRCGR